MLEQTGELSPSEYGGEKYQRRVTRLHARIDELYPKFGFSYHRARQEALRKQERWDKIIGFIPKLIGFTKNERDEPPGQIT